MKILLLCAAGMSTSLVVDQMIESLSEDEKNWIIDAKPIDYFDDIASNYDVVLLGPQMTFKKEELKKKAKEKEVPLDVIDSLSYGLGDGKKILEQAKQLANQKGEK